MKPGPTHRPGCTGLIGSHSLRGPGLQSRRQVYHRPPDSRTSVSALSPCGGSVESSGAHVLSPPCARPIVTNPSRLRFLARASSNCLRSGVRLAARPYVSRRRRAAVLLGCADDVLAPPQSGHPLIRELLSTPEVARAPASRFFPSLSVVLQNSRRPGVPRAGRIPHRAADW